MAEFIKFVGNDAKLTEKFLQDHPNFEKLIVNDANDENMQKTTALLQAAKRGHANVVEVLLKHGADVTAADTAGRSSIHFAALCTKQHLYRHGICPEELHYKGEENDSHFKTMEVLLTYIDSHKLHDIIDGRDDDGRTALMYAVMQGHTEVIEPLLHHGANLTILDNDGWNVVLYASLYGRHKLLNTFLSDSKYNLGAELVNTPNKMGYMPLVVAAEQGWESTVLILLSHGADPGALCRDKKYPHEHAEAKGHTKIAKLLREKWEQQYESKNQEL